METRYKLQLICQIIQDTFDTAQARAELVPAIVRWVQPHLGNFEFGSGMKDGDDSDSDFSRVRWLECNRLAVTVGLRFDMSCLRI